MPYVVRAFPVIRPVAELHKFLSALSDAQQSETKQAPAAGTVAAA